MASFQVGVLFGLAACCIAIGGAFALPKSCKDIYNGLHNPASGLYTIYSASGTSVAVFCDFYDGRGYTYVAKADLGQLDDFAELYAESDYVHLKIKYANGEQHVVSLEQLRAHEHSYPLSLQHSRHDGYNPPLNKALGPYIYVGFLPIEFASLKSALKPATQGYRAAGMDHTFTNCDQNPNSYIALLVNEEDRPEVPHWKNCCDNAFIRKWILDAHILPVSRRMPAEYFYQFEMHMGGCGGYLTSKHVEKDVQGVAIGFAFEIREQDNCLQSKCCG